MTWPREHMLFTAGWILRIVPAGVVFRPHGKRRLKTHNR